MKYQPIISSWILALMLVCVTGLAGAQEQSESSAATETSPLTGCLKRFDALDKKHAGKITKDEFMAVKGSSARAEKIFASQDLNHDGVVTKEEYCKGAGAGGGKAQRDPAAPCKSRFDSLDANHDGVVSKDEFMSSGRKAGAKAEELFKQKDTNGNGTLTPEELCGAAGTDKPKSPQPAPKGGA